MRFKTYSRMVKWHSLEEIDQVPEEDRVYPKCHGYHKRTVCVYGTGDVGWVSSLAKFLENNSHSFSCFNKNTSSRTSSTPITTTSRCNALKKSSEIAKLSTPVRILRIFYSPIQPIFPCLFFKKFLSMHCQTSDLKNVSSF